MGDIIEDRHRIDSVLFDFGGVLVEEDDPRVGLDYLKQEISNYWDRRQIIIALLNYLSHKPSTAMTHWKKDTEAAHLLLGAVEGDGV